MRAKINVHEDRKRKKKKKKIKTSNGQRAYDI